MKYTTLAVLLGLALGSAATMAAAEPQPELQLSHTFKRLKAPDTGRLAVQLTSGDAFAYPLYFYIPTITADGKYLIYHRAAGGEVQLHRLTLATGESRQLTFATCEDTQWRPWCVDSGRGVLDHRSVLNVVRGLVVYFDGNDVRAVDVESGEDKHLFMLPEDREAYGQNCTTPDGNWLVYIHTPKGSIWGEPCKGAAVVAYHFDTGEQKTLCTIDSAVFHVTAYDNEHFIVTHPAEHEGMMMTDMTSGRIVPLRDGDPGVKGHPIHCQATSQGIAYEVPDARVSGLYDPLTRRRFEFPFPEPFQYIHTGLDPEGRLWFYENSSDWDKFDVHDIYALVGLDRKKGDQWLRLTGTWPTYGGGQKAHFHPQLTPDRKWIMFTGGDPETETCHIFLLDVSDLKDSQGISRDLLSATGENDIVRRADDWWNPDWHYRTTVTRATPWRDATPRPVEAVIDFPLLLERAGIAGQFDPASLRVVEATADGPGREIPFAHRVEFDARAGRQQNFLTWIARPELGKVGRYDIYFDTGDGRREASPYEVGLLPPENLLANHSFENQADGLPDRWTATPKELMRLGRFDHTTGKRSLAVVVDEKTPDGVGREATISQKIDVHEFAGQEVVFECDLLAEQAAFGAPVSIELEQFRADGTRITEYVVETRWLTIELAKGQLVQFSERGRLNPEAATVNVKVRMRCSVRDADTRRTVTGPESFFTICLDRVILRPGERWPWPARTGAGFVKGMLEQAPLNRGFEFTGQRRLAFNGASEGTLTAGKYNPEPRSVHWGLEAGTLEFWCRPTPRAERSGERVFFDSVAYGHRLQSRLQTRRIDGKSHLEFIIADAGRKLRAVRGPADLQGGHDHHIAATWDFPKAQLQLFVDGKLIATEGPHDRPWPSSLVPDDKEKKPGIGIMETDRRSMPMQAFIGGDKECREERGADAVLDEFRISDIARYTGDFVPDRREFSTDRHTRALFHFENERHGVHESDDRFVRGHLACELPRQKEEVPLDAFQDGKIVRRMVSVKPQAPVELFEKNRVENRLEVTRPFAELPDPRFVEYRRQQHKRTVTADNQAFLLEVGGDYEPLMRSITFERAAGSPETTTLPRWRANDNVVPFSAESLAATLAADTTDDEEKALETMRYALEISNYYDAHFCETLPTRHRDRVSYTLMKAVNIYAFDQCGPLNYTLRKLFLSAGISSNDASGTHHQFQQAFYGGSWRLFDLSPRKYWLNRDNTTVAGRRAFEDDLYLKLRQGDGVTSGLPGRVSRARFGSAERPHSMDFSLQADERASICWHNEGRWFEVTRDRQPIPLAKVPPYFGNGAVVYEPTGQSEATVLENAEIQDTPDSAASLRAKDADKSAALIYRASCPYIFSDATVSGTYAAAADGAVRLSLSFDEGKSWAEAWQSAEQSGPINVCLREQVTGRYAYWLKIDLAAGSRATIHGLKVRSTLVASPLALPGRLSRGENRITFVGPAPSVPVATTCRWTERYRSKLGLSLNAISYYLNGDEAHRNLLVVAPGNELPVKVRLQGLTLPDTVSLANLPAGWTSRPSGDDSKLDTAEFVLRPAGASEGDVEAFDVVEGKAEPPRRVTAQVLVAEGALSCEAEQADEIDGNVTAEDSAELSGAQGMVFQGDGRLVFDLGTPTPGKYALWLRARWQPESSLAMTLGLNDDKPREFRATAMIGFTDWTSQRYAHTKMFAHFGEQYSHWSWYRIPDVELTASTHRLSLGAQSGACFDAILLLPQKPAVDRAAMNLLQNWNYAPWDNPDLGETVKLTFR